MQWLVLLVPIGVALLLHSGRLNTALLAVLATALARTGDSEKSADADAATAPGPPPSTRQHETAARSRG